MHILFICPYYPSKKFPHRGIFFRDQAIALQKSGHKVGILVLNGLNNYFDKKIDDGIPEFNSFRIPIPLKSNAKLMIGSTLLSASITLKAYIKKFGKPNVLHSHNFFNSGIIGSIFSENEGIPHVLTEHSSVFLTGLKKSEHNTLKRYIIRIPQIISVSNALADTIRNLTNIRKIKVIGNLVDISQFNISKKLKVETSYRFLTIARLGENKNTELIIRSFEKAFQGKKTVELAICGEGELKDHLINLVDKLGISSQVSFYNFLQRPELIGLYQKSNAVVSASFVETFGMTLIEGMACGLPVISTNSGGPADIINNDVGILLSSFSEFDMASAMKHMYTNHQLYNSTLIRSYCERNFSEGVIVSKIVETYEEAIDSF